MSLFYNPISNTGFLHSGRQTLQTRCKNVQTCRATAKTRSGNEERNRLCYKNGRIHPKRHIRPLYQINVRNASETFHYFAYIASCNFHDIISLWKHIGRKFHFISCTYTASIKSAYKHSACRVNLYTYIVVALQKEE